MLKQVVLKRADDAVAYDTSEQLEQALYDARREIHVRVGARIVTDVLKLRPLPCLDLTYAKGACVHRATVYCLT